MFFEGPCQENDSKGVKFKNKEPCFIAGFFMSDDFITTFEKNVIGVCKSSNMTPLIVEKIYDYFDWF